MLTIVIVNYFTTDLIRDCLDTLRQYHPMLDCEVIIVNNGDKEDVAKKFQNDYPNVKWLEMGYNSGFARANNLGIRQAKGDIILLLNPDIIFIESILTTCEQRLQENSQLVAAGVQLLNRDLSFQISGSFFVKGGLNHLLPLPYWGNFLRKIALGLKTKTPHLKESNNIENVDWINGAFIMAKKSAIDQAGLLDEDFFMYGEEVEWCSRLKAIGDLEIFCDKKIIHLVGQSSKKSADKEYYDLYSKKGFQIMLSNHLKVRKQFGIFWMLILFGNYLFAAILAVPISLIINILRIKTVKTKNALLFLKNTLKLMTYLPRMILNKPYFYKVM